MTFALILGGAVAFYFIWFLFRLAAHALPVCAGIATTCALLDRGTSYPASIIAGVAVGVLILVSARLLLAANIGPAVRGAVTLTFAVPAALAGYAATRSIMGLAGAEDMTLFLFSLAGASATASASWRCLAGGMPSADRAPTVAQERSP